MTEIYKNHVGESSKLLPKLGHGAALRESASAMRGTEMLNSILAMLESRADGVNMGGDINIMDAVDRIVKRESAREAPSEANEIIEACARECDIQAKFADEDERPDSATNVIGKVAKMLAKQIRALKREASPDAPAAPKEK